MTHAHIAELIAAGYAAMVLTMSIAAARGPRAAHPTPALHTEQADR